ncbi:protein TBATA-like isoform X2 [Apostichopus japonicus]|uniref:protein TBATA-like isoform X2 n=1 Tax=Stichopus japonicus TaxID=307972 RepID=UPI003AB8200B
MPLFKPEGGEPLVVRSTLGSVPEHNAKTHMLPMTQKDFAGARPATGAKVRFGQLTQSSFFARHNPQPGRVRHIKGLLDVPICAVHDDGSIKEPSNLLRAPSSAERRSLYSFHIPRISSAPYRIFNQNPVLNSHRYPINTITGMSTYPKGFKDLANHLPYTDDWRNELVSLVDKAGLGLPKEVKDYQREQPKRTSVYSAETGRLIPPPSRAMSRGASRQRQREPFLHIAPEQSNENLVLEMLCQILQTDSIGAVQEWLVSSGDKEKDLALNIIKVALGAEDTYWKQLEEPAVTPFDSFLDFRPMSQPPSNMIVENGYAEMDRPSPRLRAGTSMGRLGTGFSRYSYQGDKKLPGSPREQFKFDGNGNPSLRPLSHKPDILKIDHSVRPTSRPQTRTGSPRGGAQGHTQTSPVPGTPQRLHISSRTQGNQE